MDAESAIRREIEQLEAIPQVIRLRNLRLALDALTQSPKPAIAREPVAVIRDRGGLPSSWARAVRLLPADGVAFHDYREQYGQDRGKPIAEGSFAAQLSKMKGANLIHKRGDRWFAGPQTNTPEDGDSPSQSPGVSGYSNQGDSNAEKTVG